MPSVYVSEETLKKLQKFINRSRVSPYFGAEKLLTSNNYAIAFLLDIALRFDFKDFAKLAKIPIIEGEIPVEIFDDEEAKIHFFKKEFEALEDETD